MKSHCISQQIAFLGLFLFSGASAVMAEEPATSEADKKFFSDQVVPLLESHCLRCHGEDANKVRGGLNMTARAAVLAGGDTGPTVDLKSPEKSLLLTAIYYKDEAYQMPPKGKLPDADIETLEQWVKRGLPWDEKALESTAGEQEVAHAGADKSYWAFQPVKKPTVPEVRNAKWARNPIDHFVLAKLEEKQLSPVGEADRVTLVRRVYYDLTGLPPTPEQVDRFVNDPDADPLPKLVDELLESPAYGEKWGRHWLDLVRYAESNGYERDGEKPFAWKYRDYVIRSFQNDKPYDLFLREQLAGDEMPGHNPEAVIATGYYRLGVWDDEPADRAQALFDGYDDIITVTGQVMLGLTLNCARCHEHKGDGFPQTDYYKFLAFFRDIRPHTYDRGPRSASFTDISPPEVRRQYESALALRQEKLDLLNKTIIGIENAGIRKMPAPDQRASEGRDRPRVLRQLPKFLSRSQNREYQRLVAERQAIEKERLPELELALSVNNNEINPPPVKLLIRGNPHAEGPVVNVGFPEVFDLPDPRVRPRQKSSGRRTALARWITSPDNPLTARVMVNRVWQYHFGQGLVPTPNDFGKLGEPPTHPELLDWLAREFTQPNAEAGEPWTIKRVHKLIMLSSTYRLASTNHTANAEIDPGNNLYWRFNPRRLNAEEVRDSILTVSGSLIDQQFGPSVFPKLPREVLAGQSRPGEGWRTSPGEQANRRSIYVFVKRSLQVPVLLAHDQADSDSSCPVRYTTTVPTQALGMLNGEFTHEQAKKLAERLSQAKPGNPQEQVALGIRLTTGREPTEKEVTKDVEFIEEMQNRHGLDAQTALARYALLLLNTNEFVYLD